MASGTIKNHSKSIIQKVVSETYTLTTDHVKVATIHVPTIAGYSFMGILGIGSDHYIECMVNAWPITHADIQVGIRDIAGYITSLTVNFYLLYVRSDLADYRT